MKTTFKLRVGALAALGVGALLLVLALVPLARAQGTLPLNADCQTGGAASCASNYCDGATGTCQLFPNGHDCQEGGAASCASHYCDGATFTCQPAPVQQGPTVQGSGVGQGPTVQGSGVGQGPTVQGSGVGQGPTVTSYPNVTLFNPLSAGTNLEQFINDILALVIRIGAIVVIFMLIYVGYLFVTAGGDTGQVSEARHALLWTVVGALILLGAQAIASGIQATVQAISQGH